ncbi:hypothetical protein [Pseudomonas sp. GOM6]|nr:hypothetical protein [Pseudomonas sp. GOM6]MDG1580945.1 hypothetical protein [Pseudomonas sp. GOM6]
MGGDNPYVDVMVDASLELEPGVLLVHALNKPRHSRAIVLAMLPSG